MAKKEDLNLGSGRADAGTATGAGKTRMLLLAVVLPLVLLAAGAGAWFMFGGGGEAADDADVVQAPKAEQRDPTYLPLDKFLVNFDHKGDIRYVQTDIQLMAYDPKVLERVERDMPAVRNRVIMLLSDQDFDVLRTVAGKEALRQDVLRAVNEVLDLTGSAAVQEAYFTSFVLQ